MQVFVHIASISGLIPLTGVPLPFISYGGTALAIFLTMSGVIVNISKYT
ncbi:MAG: FtsW/RodA/SpoVE family cell cycle protein [Candidatus Paceibacterota bacterium]